MDNHNVPTARLVLRQWRDADRAPFAAMNADPEVMRHFPSPLTPEESDRLVDEFESGLAQRGYGLWALELAASGEFLGYTGLAPVSFEARFTPAIEVGWRLARWAWGNGYATEAARAALRIGFTQPGPSEVVSFTSVRNERSRAVMRRLSMTRDPAEDFDHPKLDPGHPLCRHVLYRLSRQVVDDDL